jgi:hypothetical protein
MELEDELAVINPFSMLLRAHDKVWSNRSIPLEERKRSCDLIWSRIALIS